MDLFIDIKSGRPIYDQIYSQIRDQIIAGSLTEHQMLPSIRGLAKDLRISFLTTKHAYDQLESEGFLYTIPGKGCYVAPKNPALIREDSLRNIEDHFSQIALLARIGGITRNELLQILDMTLEDEI